MMFGGNQQPGSGCVLPSGGIAVRTTYYYTGTAKTLRGAHGRGRWGDIGSITDSNLLYGGCRPRDGLRCRVVMGQKMDSGEPPICQMGE